MRGYRRPRTPPDHRGAPHRPPVRWPPPVFRATGIRRESGVRAPARRVPPPDRTGAEDGR
ncbi:MAG: hypothetical protein E4H44_05670 [Candidatus Aminicenantes bacterium]|nr:MAG: hypothetical protein E4H44_05670 [Candidatus Aminicenantes bacterium]